MTSATTSSTPGSSIRQPKVAVVGCGHGELDTIYATLEARCAQKGWTVDELDFLIICGDFQAARNDADLNCMSVPRKYRKLCDFHKYYSGEATAPVLTLVIGGNHEASNYFFELYHGGWLAPNIYYLGAAGVIRYGPWRIAGLSGIYGAGDYRKPHGERLPYEYGHIRSIYHVREYNVQRLLQTRSQVDIGLSHDWPAWIELFGDYGGLFANKPHFLESARQDNLGSKPAAAVMNHLRPSYWFSGHMHTRFSATVEYRDAKTMEDAVRGQPVSGAIQSSLPVFKEGGSRVTPAEGSCSLRDKTAFLALSKVGSADRLYMAVEELDLPVRPEDSTEAYLQTTDSGRFHLFYDKEWLAITRAYAGSLRVADAQTLVVPPAKPRARKDPGVLLGEQMAWVKQNIVDKGLLRVPDNFVAEAPTQRVSSAAAESPQQPPEYPNEQTAQFSELLQMGNPFARPEAAEEHDWGTDGIYLA